MAMRKTKEKEAKKMNIILITEYNEKRQNTLMETVNVILRVAKLPPEEKKYLTEMEICCSDKFVIERNFYCNVM